ncbi:MAG: 1-acyl-sn-glycerol-3-phosphate acyltransferase [Desulfohalobiaceae bacterium]|nr:1-acyl-sn-glycerol-3-phosphate acyltransferase [Desulfohalobiaceae bacterium]
MIVFCVCLLSLFPGTKGLLQKLELFWARATVLAAGVKLEKSRVDPGLQTNSIFIGNHQSWLDIPVFLTVLAPYAPRFVAKETLFRVPIFASGMRRMGHLSINRTNNRKGMRDIQLVAERVNQGESVLIFPEGTRNTDSRQLKGFHIGAFVLALKADRPVVPVVVQGTGRVLPRGSLTVRPGTVTVRAGEPLNVKAGYSLKDRGRLRDDVQAKMQELLTETNT